VAAAIQPQMNRATDQARAARYHYGMSPKFDEREFLSRVYTERRVPKEPETVRIDDAANCNGIRCNTAWVPPDRNEIMLPEPHSHLIGTDVDGFFDVEAIFKNP
jgi:hypothetical protein